MSQQSVINTIDPSNEEVLSSYEPMSKEQVVRMVKDAKNAMSSWKENEEKRRGHIYNLAEYFEKEKVNLAKVASKEMGKVLKESISEVEKCAWVLQFYADHGPVFLHDEVLNTDARKSVITFEPLGVIGSIMPWNFPYWQAMRFAAPSMMAGNTVVMKPSSTTTQCGLELQKACEEVGLPPAIFQSIVGSSDATHHLIEAETDAITFTGSEKVGSIIGQKTTSLLKKCVLELGGSDPFIVLDDANIDKAASGAVKGRFINAGQSCIASKRFFVSSKVADEFMEKMVKEASKLKVGNPLSEESDMGPMVNKSALETIESMVEDAKSKGAEVLFGGERLNDKGYFYAPTILKNVTSDMRVAKEETFGPVAPITVFDIDKDAITMANDSPYGLGASIWTEDLGKADQLARKIDAGVVSVNNVVRSDPRIPFGGIKHSGFGRELSRYGMLEFVNIKSVRFYDKLIHQHYVE